MTNSIKLLTAIGSCLACCGGAYAAKWDVNSQGAFRAALAGAQPGDEIVLQSGVYPGGFFRQSLNDVVIRSADPLNPAIIDALGFGEAIKLETSNRVTISDLQIRNASQNGINIDDGGFRTPSTDITLRNLLLTNGDGHGIKLTGVNGFLIDEVEVLNWGQGFAGINLLGSNNGLVQNSLVHRTSPAGGFGIKAEAGSTDIKVRANRFVDAGERAIQFGGGVPSGTFRPQPAGNTTAKDIVAEGNVVVSRGSAAGRIQAAVAFVGTDGSTFRNNLVYRPSRFAGRILKENVESGFVDTQNGEFADNVFIWQHGDIIDGINFGPSTLPSSFTFSGNTWFNSTNPSASKLVLPAEETDGIYGIDPGFGPDDLIPWSFDWGSWLVNATGEAKTFILEDPSLFLLAEPGPEAELDFGLANPLIGDWQLFPLQSTELAVFPYSDTVLLRQMMEQIEGDFDGDGLLGFSDIDLLSAAVRESSTDRLFDLNIDEIVDDEDRRYWVEDVFGTIFGDATLDNKVDFSDFLAVSRSFDQPGGWNQGDFDGDGKTLFADFLTLSRNFDSSAASLAVVPEPPAIATLALSVLILLGRRRQRVSSDTL